MNNLDGGDDLFFPGFYLSYDLTEHLWISSGYVAGEVDFTIPGSTLAAGTIEEDDFDLVIGWSLPKVDVGVGYRDAKFTTNVLGASIPIDSAGPMVYLGGGHFWRRWGYYWGVAFMFQDLEDDDGSQKHINGEGGLRWDPRGKNFHILFGYRHKEYSGEGLDGATFGGPVVNLGYTWR